MDIKQLCQKMKVPFEEFDAEFDLSTIEGNAQKKMAEKIVEKVEKYRKLLEEFLNADGNSYAVLTEMKGMDEDKETLHSLYRELIVLERDFQLSDLENMDMEKFIKHALTKWNAVKPGLIEFIRKAKDAWKDSKSMEEELGYLG